MRPFATKRNDAFRRTAADGCRRGGDLAENRFQTKVFTFLHQLGVPSGNASAERTANVVWNRFSSMLELRPKTTVSWYRHRGLYRVADDLEFVLEGARMAGLPE